MKLDRKITVLIVDDHAIVRSGVIALLSLDSQIEIVGEAATGRSGVEQAIAKEPDVVLMDIGMPELNGLEATRQIKKLVPGTKVLVLSGHDSEEYVLEIMESGASGYLLKSALTNELEAAIVAVSRGGKFFSPSLSGLVSENNKSTRMSSRAGKPTLTPREREILQLIAEGKSHSTIALLLHISVRTVDTHRNNILKKLDLHDAAGLVNYAIRNGIVFLPK